MQTADSWPIPRSGGAGNVLITRCRSGHQLVERDGETGGVTLSTVVELYEGAVMSCSVDKGNGMRANKNSIKQLLFIVRD